MKRSFLLSTLALLGFSSCSEPSENNLCMYGTPPVDDFIFKGTLVDAEGNPIKGIAVQVAYEEAVASAEDGAFLSEFSAYSSSSYDVSFTDVDGQENGGEFASKQVAVQWDEADEEQTDKQVYDLGTITLDKKEE